MHACTHARTHYHYPSKHCPPKITEIDTFLTAVHLLFAFDIFNLFILLSLVLIFSAIIFFFKILLQFCASFYFFGFLWACIVQFHLQIWLSCKAWHYDFHGHMSFLQLFVQSRAIKMWCTFYKIINMLSMFLIYSRLTLSLYHFGWDRKYDWSLQNFQCQIMCCPSTNAQLVNCHSALIFLLESLHIREGDNALKHLTPCALDIFQRLTEMS